MCFLWSGSDSAQDFIIVYTNVYIYCRWRSIVIKSGNRIDISGVMVSVLASSAVDYGLEPRSGQTKD